MKPKANHANPARMYRSAKGLRQDSPLAEKLLWLHLRVQGKAAGLKFRRQQPISPHIVDFASFAPRLVIEIDGMSHDNPARILADEKRDYSLRQSGFTVLRFTDSDVMKDVQSVVATILLRAESLRCSVAPLTPPPTPPARGGE